MSAASLTIDGKRFVVMPQDEYERMRQLARELPRIAGPRLPRPDTAGNVPAVEFARATLARKLIRDRRRVGLTQADLARRAGVKLELLCRIEKGKTMPDSATFNRIHRALERAERQALHANR
jgi:DNA-binding XRE family transcriptional regulator